MYWTQTIHRARQTREDETGELADFILVRPEVWGELAFEHNGVEPADIEGLQFAICESLDKPFEFGRRLVAES